MGSSFLYMANAMIRIDPKDKLDPEGNSNQQRLGIKGFMADVTIIKSRTSEAGRIVEIVYSQNDGFLDAFSTVLFLRQKDLLMGSPRAYYLEGLENVKFTMKKFQEIYNENEEFRNYFHEYSRKHLKEIIPNYGKYDSDMALLAGEEGKITDKYGNAYTLINKEEDIWLSEVDGKYYDSNFSEISVEIDQ